MTKRKPSEKSVAQRAKIDHEKGLCGPHCKFCSPETINQLDLHLAEGCDSTTCQFCLGTHNSQPTMKIPVALVERLKDDLKKLIEWSKSS